jgi:YfiR/HmsC-like
MNRISLCDKSRNNFRKGLLLTFLILSVQAHAQPTNEDQVKAVFLYNFTHFVKWPPSSFQSPDSPFIIGIVGDATVPYLRVLVDGESYEGHPIEVRLLTDKKTIAECHLVFIEQAEAAFTKEVMRALQGKSVLTVGDAPSFLHDGGIIRFFKEHNKIRLEIHAKKAEDTQLDISAKLLNLATRYQ